MYFVILAMIVGRFSGSRPTCVNKEAILCN